MFERCCSPYAHARISAVEVDEAVAARSSPEALRRALEAVGYEQLREAITAAVEN